MDFVAIRKKKKKVRTTIVIQQSQQDHHLLTDEVVGRTKAHRNQNKPFTKN